MGVVEPILSYRDCLYLKDPEEINSEKTNNILIRASLTVKFKKIKFNGLSLRLKNRRLFPFEFAPIKIIYRYVY